MQNFACNADAASPLSQVTYRFVCMDKSGDVTRPSPAMLLQATGLIIFFSGCVPGQEIVKRIGICDYGRPIAEISHHTKTRRSRAGVVAPLT